MKARVGKTGPLIGIFALAAAQALLADECPDAEPFDVMHNKTEIIKIELVGEFVSISAGSGCMGDRTGDGEADEQPAHQTRISAFLLARYEVTRGQFAHFVAATGYVTDAEREGSQQSGCMGVDPEEWSFKYRADWNWRSPGFEQAENHPVVCVSYNDALAFIEWLNQETGYLFRLPTEAEWEYVAHAGSRSVYPWGDDAVYGCARANVADRNAWPGYEKSPFGRIDCNDGYAFTAPVGSYAPNRFGIFDMSGNVWEWNADCYQKSYSGASNDGSAFNAPQCRLRVFRGSSWMNSAKSVRSSNRSKNGESDRLNTVGFRLALDQ
jgi:formylglycine-generating enzyme required for sulfatase activity